MTLHKMVVYACIVGVVAVVVLGGAYFVKRSKLINDAREQATEKVIRATRKIDASLNTLVPVNIKISEDLTSGRLAHDHEQIVARLKQVKGENPSIFGVGVAFVPFAFDPQKRLYAPLYVNREGEHNPGPELIQIEDRYDYTGPDRDWYHRPLAEGPVWQEPHYGQASEVFLANFTTPFFRRDPVADEVIANGVVFTSMSLDQYRDMVAGLGFGDSGYGFLLSRKGAFVSHPDRDWVLEKKTMGDWANQSGDPKLQNLSQRADAGKRGFAEHTDPATGKSQWVFIEPIISTGWTLGVVFNKESIAGWTQLAFWRTGFLASSIATLALLIMMFLLKTKRARLETPVSATS